MKFAQLVSIGLFALIAAVSPAHEKIYTTVLSGPAEAPPNASPGTGFATVTLDLDLVTMRVQADFSGLTGNVTASHIHASTAVPGAGTAGVATQTPSFSGFPTGVTSGTYDHTFDMTSAASYNSTFINANGGNVSGALNAFIVALDSGRAYLNVHTTAFSAGEIRGFLTAIPEPSAYGLFAGMAGLAFVISRRRR